MEAKKIKKADKETQFKELIRELTYRDFLLLEKFIHRNFSAVEPNKLHNR